MTKLNELHNLKRKSIPNKHLDIWMEWMANNLDLAEKEYPEMMELVREMIKETPPYITAAIIEKTPENFSKWKIDIENCLPSTKEKKLKIYIELIELLLYKLEFNTDIENLAVNKIKPELIEMETYFKGILRKPKIQHKKSSYKWCNNPDKELRELYKLMINKYKLIASETTYEQFKAVFTVKPIETINPIKWHQDNASELLYFIYRLEQSNNIAYNPKKADYKKMTDCFVKPDGNEFNAVWKSLKTHLEINLSPNKQKAIDELINNF